MSDSSSLALPPMDKINRKIVHDIATSFKLKSKSAGNGKERFPVLYRTSRTSGYVESTFDIIAARLTRRFLPRMDVGGKRSSGGPKRAGRGGGFNSAAVNYRDGDVVGASAPEIGSENKGRTILQSISLAQLASHVTLRVS